MFKIGDYVMSGDHRHVGIVFEVSEALEPDFPYHDQFCSVFWCDGDTTCTEDEKSMHHYQITPEQWTPKLIRFYVDTFCP